MKEADRPQVSPQPWLTRAWFRVLGAVLIVLSLVGFVTVADDRRHIGEILAVTSILIAGLALLGASFPNPASRLLTLPWLAASAIAGTLVGAATDQMVLAVVGGILVGLILGAATRSRG